MATTSDQRRVLFLAPYLGEGGINVHMLTLGSELRKLGWDVAICSGGRLEEGPRATSERQADGVGAARAEDYERAGITHVEVAFPRHAYRLRGAAQLLKMPLAMWQIVRAVRRLRPAIVHSHSRQMGIYARVAEMVTGVPFVSTVHNPIPTTNRLWSQTIGARAFAISREIELILERDYGVDESQVQVLFAAADPERFRLPDFEERRAAREHHGVRPEQLSLAFIGSINSNKRPETLLEAVAQLGRRGHDVVGLLAGRGPSEDLLREQAQRLGIEDRIRFLGYQDAREVLWAADALVLPSRSEGSPLVVVEAMMSGVVVLRTPAGGADQTTPDVDGIVFDHGDHDELAQRVAELIERPEFRASITQNALEVARSRFSSAALARLVSETYLDVIGVKRA